MNTRKSIIALLVGLSTLTIQAQTYFVSPIGNDQNSGTKEKPFATLEKARDAVRKTHKAGAEATVFIRSGVYTLENPFILTQEDNQTTYAAYNDEKVIVRGSKVIKSSDFHKITDKATLQRIDPKLRSAILEVDLKTLNIKNAKKYADLFNDDGGIIDLFMNNERMPLSRYPNSGDMTMKKVIINGGGQEVKNADWANFYAAGQKEAAKPRPGVFEYRDKRTNRWANVLDRGVWIKGFWRIPWQQKMLQSTANERPEC